MQQLARNFIFSLLPVPVCALWGPRPCPAGAHTHGVGGGYTLQSPVGGGSCGCEGLSLTKRGGRRCPGIPRLGCDSSVSSAEEQGWWLPTRCARWSFVFSAVPSTCSPDGGPCGGTGYRLPPLPRDSSVWLQQRAASAHRVREIGPVLAVYSGAGGDRGPLLIFQKTLGRGEGSLQITE